MTPAQVWIALTAEERALVIRLCLPSMRRAPLLLTLRYQARAAGLAQRRILGPNGQRWAFARYLIASGRLSDE